MSDKPNYISYVMGYAAGYVITGTSGYTPYYLEDRLYDAQNRPYTQTIVYASQEAAINAVRKHKKATAEHFAKVLPGSVDTSRYFVRLYEYITPNYKNAEELCKYKIDGKPVLWRDAGALKGWVWLDEIPQEHAAYFGGSHTSIKG